MDLVAKQVCHFPASPTRTGTTGPAAAWAPRCPPPRCSLTKTGSSGFAQATRCRTATRSPQFGFPTHPQPFNLAFSYRVTIRSSSSWGLGRSGAAMGILPVAVAPTLDPGGLRSCRPPSFFFGCRGRLSHCICTSSDPEN